MYRIVIADDEAMERKVLEKMIRESCPEAELLPSVSNGIELVNCIETYAPDIAVIDINMPGFNGLDAMEIVRLKNLQTHFIVVSAYGKFEYAQKAIHLGACDYLLKPVSEAKLAQSIQKVAGQLQEEQRQQADKTGIANMVQTYQTTRENELMSALLLGELSGEQTESYLSERNRKFYAGCILCIRSLEECGDTDTERDIFLHFLEQMKRISSCMGKVYRHDLIVCLFLGTEISDHEWKTGVEDTLTCVLSALGEKKLKIGVSGCKYVPEELYNGIRESQAALIGGSSESGQFFSEEIVFYSALAGMGRKNSIPSMLDQCMEFLRQKHQAGFSDALKQIAEHAGGPKAAGNILNLYMAVFLYRAVQELAPHRRMELFCSKAYSSIFEQTDTTALLTDVYELAAQLIFGGEEPAYHRYVQKSLAYIEQHYMENLTLDQAAGEIGISSFYLSRLFKQCLDNTFLNILTNLRLTKALELLASEKYTVQEISEMAGYLNVSYFYKLIKKQTGLTVSEIRRVLES